MSDLIGKALDFEARWERPITIILAIFLFASSADYAGFITLPDIPGIDEQTIFFWGSIAFNVMWHGFARPAMMRRKADRQPIAMGEEG